MLTKSSFWHRKTLPKSYGELNKAQCCTQKKFWVYKKKVMQQKKRDDDNIYMLGLEKKSPANKKKVMRIIFTFSIVTVAASYIFTYGLDIVFDAYF